MAELTEKQKLIISVSSELREHAEKYWFRYVKTGDEKCHDRYHFIHDLAKKLEATNA